MRISAARSSSPLRVERINSVTNLPLMKFPLIAKHRHRCRLLYNFHRCARTVLSESLLSDEYGPEKMCKRNCFTHKLCKYENDIFRNFRMILNITVTVIYQFMCDNTKKIHRMFIIRLRARECYVLHIWPCPIIIYHYEELILNYGDVMT